MHQKSTGSCQIDHVIRKEKQYPWVLDANIVWQLFNFNCNCNSGDWVSDKTVAGDAVASKKLSKHNKELDKSLTLRMRFVNM